MGNGAAKVTFRTVDISEIIPAISLSVGAIVIASTKGDADNPVLVTSKAQFTDLYGSPATTDLGHYSALGFLETGRSLYVMRVHNGALYGGVEVKKSGSLFSATPLSVGESTPTSHSFGADGLFLIYAANPGDWSDSISVVIDSADIDTTNHEFKIKVYVTDLDGVTNLEETWLVSRQNKIDGFGNQMYLQTKINGYSKHIKVYDNAAEGSTVDPKAVSSTTFDGGADGSTVADAQVVTGWDKFSNSFDRSVGLLICGGQTGISVLTKMITVSEARQDCFAILDMPLATANGTVSSQVSWVSSTLAANTSFAAIYSPWIKIFDEVNGQVLTVPPSGHIAAVFAKTDFIYGAAHGAPAGYNRGILNCLGLSTTTPYTSSELDTLQNGKINPLVRDAGFGTVVFGEDTLITKDSALKAIHIRRLINSIQVSTTSFAKPFLFEPLIERTYFRVRSSLEEYLSGLEGLGAFDNVNDRGWRVVCDATNNTASDRDSNILNVWIFVKPVKVAKYIQIKVVITRSSANFDAVISSGIV